MPILKPTYSPWKPIESAPKNEHGVDKWILGVDKFSEIKVIRWTTEYPSDGEWMFAYEPNDYIAGIQGFNPTHWMELPVSPHKIPTPLKLYGILDTFHPDLYQSQEIRSDDICFNGDDELFFQWCRQHGADNKWYEIN
jgi:hypothetical protein